MRIDPVATYQEVGERLRWRMQLGPDTAAPRAQVDEGDAEALCAGNPAGQVCASSICCPYSNLNLDGDPGNGCECPVGPAPGAGANCGSAIGLGPVTDVGEAGQTITVMDNALPAGREVWYRFTANDSADATCDFYHVRVRFLQNPGNRYRFNLFRGCGTVLCDGNAGYTDANWAVDAMSGSVGQCPCAANNAGVNTCGNDSQDFMIRVRWANTANPTCEQYELEITNGVY